MERMNDTERCYPSMKNITDMIMRNYRDYCLFFSSHIHTVLCPVYTHRAEHSSEGKFRSHFQAKEHQPFNRKYKLFQIPVCKPYHNFSGLNGPTAAPQSGHERQIKAQVLLCWFTHSRSIFSLPSCALNYKQLG